MPARTDIKTIMVLGSGPIVIGQACEFDYSGTQACKALRALGYRVVLLNSNPATIPNDLRAALDAQEKTWLVQALEDSNWRQKDAALALGINYNQIRGLMKKHALRTRAARSSA